MRFPRLVSLSRFVELQQKTTMPMAIFLKTFCLSQSTGISFVDSTPLKVCHIRREHSNKVFKGLATKGQCSIGWFFGFKLHLIINDRGEILDFMLTQGNEDNHEPLKQKPFHDKIFGKLFGDKGYICKALFERALIETVNDELKNIRQIEHFRHRSIEYFPTNLLSGLIAYSFFPKEPSLNIDVIDRNALEPKN